MKLRTRKKGTGSRFPALLRQYFNENLASLVDEEMHEALKDAEFREAVRRAAREISRGLKKLIAKWDEDEHPGR